MNSSQETPNLNTFNRPPGGGSGTERRSNNRRSATGGVWLEFANPLPRQVLGELMDVSLNGFRASHRCPSLCTGDEVNFRHPQGSGTARVVWNRIVADCSESGFLILRRDS